MKVYAVIEDWCVDYEKGETITLFQKLEDARKYAREQIDSIKDMDCYNVEEEEDYYYDGYIEGEHVNNHTTIYIEEKEVK